MGTRKMTLAKARDLHGGDIFHTRGDGSVSLQREDHGKVRPYSAARIVENRGHAILDMGGSPLGAPGMVGGPGGAVGGANAPVPTDDVRVALSFDASGASRMAVSSAGANPPTPSAVDASRRGGKAGAHAPPHVPPGAMPAHVAAFDAMVRQPRPPEPMIYRQYKQAASSVVLGGGY